MKREVQVSTVLESRGGYFPDGLEINGQKLEGAYYVLSREAYKALLLN